MSILHGYNVTQHCKFSALQIDERPPGIQLNFRPPGYNSGMKKESDQYYDRNATIHHRISPNGREIIYPCLVRIVNLVTNRYGFAFFEKDIIISIEPNGILVSHKHDIGIYMYVSAGIAFSHESHRAIYFPGFCQPDYFI